MKIRRVDADRENIYTCKHCLKMSTELDCKKMFEIQFDSGYIYLCDKCIQELENSLEVSI